MSTPEALRRLEMPDTPTTPAVLTDETGKSILPTERLPGVDFGAHMGGVDGEDGEDGEDADQQPLRTLNTEHAEDAERLGKSVTSPHDDHGHAAREAFALARAQTAPGRSRPKPLTRTSTLFRAMRRSPDPFAYTFDPMSSDSSSSEDEGGRRRSARPGKAAKKAVSKEKEQQKQDAKEGRSYSRFRVSNEHFCSKGKVSKRDGRLDISINETATSGYLAKALGRTVKHHLDIPNRSRQRKQRQYANNHPPRDADADAESVASLHPTSRPRLNIVIMIIGSRGDIQPFLKLGKILKDDHGHRVRIATHPTFRDFVEKESDLEFFSVGGDPSELMAFMVKNPGLIPNLSTIREGEIPRRRKAMGEMFHGMYRACIDSTDDLSDTLNLKLMADKSPFIADAIIANPPSMAHVHIAERLGIPLHIMFTFPYSPTQAFPHPLANIRTGKSNVDANYINFVSYPMVEMMTWQGLGDIVNRFRVKTLGLEPVSSLWAPGALYRMKVPYTYMWSPSLVPKPSDWGPEIDISGFVFMDLAKNFTPPDDLQAFLDAGEAPVYIGFGSIVVDDPNKFTEMIFEAVKIAGVRALVNKGWGGLGQGNNDTPDNIFMLENTPHDWLFPKVKAVIHHGGAGTTAIGLKCAKPTMIIPFFGDQPFWAARVVEAKAGALEVTPWKKLTAAKLAEGIKQCLTEEAQVNVQKLADGIAREGDGAENAVLSFHRSLPLKGVTNMRCSILEDRVAVWRIKGSALRLSALAAEILQEKGKIKPNDLRLLHKVQWNDFDGPGEPITGAAGAFTDSLYGIGAGMGMVPIRVAKHLKERAEHERKKAEKRKRKEERKERKRAKKGEEPPLTAQRPIAHREDTAKTIESILSVTNSEHLARDVAHDVRKGIKESGWALMTMPNNLHMAVAQGFHNAPRLWGDATVRKPIRITGIKTGFVAARREFTYGIYDAWTGLVTQPVGGFRDGDTIPAKLVGLGHGFGKGIGGFVLKNLSAVISPPAYAGKGILVYIKKRSTAESTGSKAFIRRAHLVQGQKDLQALRQQNDPEKEAQLQNIYNKIDEGWKVYEEIWAAAYKEYGPVGGGLIARLKLDREKHRWQKAGAFETIHTAERALKAHQRGEDLDNHFANRRLEMESAEQPRVSAMDDPSQDEPRPGDIPKVDTTYADDQTEREKQRSASAKESDDRKRSSDESDSTVVAASGEDDKKRDNSALPANVKLGDNVIIKGIAGGRPMLPIGRVTTA